MNVEISVKAGQSCFEWPEPLGHFLAELQICCRIFPSNAKDSPFVPAPCYPPVDYGTACNQH